MITEKQVAAWVERQPVAVIGRPYQMSEPKDVKAFCEWFARVADEIENLGKVDPTIRPVPCAVSGCRRLVELSHGNILGFCADHRAEGSI